MTQVVQKASNGVSMAFPDVCLTPGSTAGGVPIPYPNFATTATSKTTAQKTTLQSKQVRTVASRFTSVGDEAGVSAGVIASETNLLKTELTSLHGRLLSLPANDPNAWQDVLQRYLVAASALYLTRHAR